MTPPRQKRKRRQDGWIELDKHTAPHSWKARWLDWSQTRTDKSGRIRPMQRSFVDQSPASWLFPSSRKRGKDRMPVDPGNWLKRVLQPAAEELGFAL